MFEICEKNNFIALSSEMETNWKPLGGVHIIKYRVSFTF